MAWTLLWGHAIKKKIHGTVVGAITGRETFRWGYGDYYGEVRHNFGIFPNLTRHTTVLKPFCHAGSTIPDSTQKILSTPLSWRRPSYCPRCQVKVSAIGLYSWNPNKPIIFVKIVTNPFNGCECIQISGIGAAPVIFQTHIHGTFVGEISGRETFRWGFIRQVIEKGNCPIFT